MSTRVTGDPTAIGYVSFAFLRDAKPLSLMGDCGLTSEPSAFNIKAEEYPLRRRLYLYSRPDLAGPGQDLVDFILSPAADDTITKAGFVNFSVDRQQRDFTAADIATQLAGIENNVEYSMTQDMLAEMNAWDRLSTTIRLPVNSPLLGAKELNDLERLIGYLSEQPEGTEVTFVGFTDTDGELDANRDLGEARALNVARQIDEMGRERMLNVEFSARSYGELNPLACNTAEFGKAINRRVEVWIKTP